MSDNTRYGDPSDFDVSLHSIYAAYLWVFLPFPSGRTRAHFDVEASSSLRVQIGGTSHGEATSPRSANFSALDGKPWVRGHQVQCHIEAEYSIVVVDSGTSRPHIAVRREQIVLFAKMIRTR